jgi:molybdenum cofactor biosynthesis enzyme MoaA
MQPINFYFEQAPENNTFYSIFVDITHRCNMECANCYVPNREIADMDKEKFYEVLRKLPNKTEIRLIGGEPTVRTDLFEIIAKIKEYGHRSTMQTNGLMLARPGYVRNLVSAGMRSIYISMNGADDNDVYEIMDGTRCAERKIAAWQACVDAKMNVNIGCILQKGVNDHVPQRMFELAKKIGGHPILRFRNVGQIGRYSIEKEDNWTFDEVVGRICSICNVDPAWAKTFNTVNGYVNESGSILFPLDETRRLKTTWVKITDWSPIDSKLPGGNRNRRGRITQNFKIAPHWEHVVMNENGY